MNKNVIRDSIRENRNEIGNLNKILRSAIREGNLDKVEKTRTDIRQLEDMQTGLWAQLNDIIAQEQLIEQERNEKLKIKGQKNREKILRSREASARRLGDPVKTQKKPLLVKLVR